MFNVRKDQFQGGRPSMSVRIDPDIYDRVKAAAERNGVGIKKEIELRLLVSLLER